MEVLHKFESVAVSTRMRLARNFADYPFPNLLLRDAHAEEQALEMQRIVATEMNRVDAFKLYEMKCVSPEVSAFLMERNLISRELISNRRISAALISKDESISVMVNEEDHLRVQYFVKWLALEKAYERISGIDELISDCIPFAYDSQFGYLTACPTNLGTGLRASVMLFLPALSRRGLMKKTIPILARGGLTVRGASGEGSGSEGELYQVSNETTLGLSEGEFIALVGQAVNTITELELRERMCMKAEGGYALPDRLSRSYGVLTCCKKITLSELVTRVADVKLGIALGYFVGQDEGETLMSALDDLLVELRPANFNRLSGGRLEEEERDVYRARFVQKTFETLRLSV